MPTVEQHENALRKALAAGDTEAADFIRGELGRAKEEQNAKGVLATMSPLERGLAGAGEGALRMWKNVGNLIPGLGDKLPGAGDVDNAASQALNSTTAGGVGKFLGEAGALAPIGMGVGGAVAKGVGGAAAPWLGAASAGAAEGFAGGEEGHRLEGAGIGALAGPAAVAGGKALAKGAEFIGLPQAVKAVTRGLGKPTEAAQRLLDQGVPLTTGQRLGSQTGFGRLEEAATSLPGAGPIRNMRNAATTEVNELQRGFSSPPVEPGQPRVPINRGLSSEAANEELQAQFREAYSKVNGWPMEPVTGHPGSPQSVDLLTAAKRAASSRNVGELPRSARKDVENFLVEEISGLTPNKNGHVMSDDLLDVRERVRAEVRDLLSNPDSNVDIKKARIYKEFLKDLDNGISEQLPKQYSDFLKEVDKHYASYAPLKSASVMQQRTLGVGQNPTPAQMLRTVTGDMSPSALAAGDFRFPNQQLARDAAEVIPTRAPATGERVATLAPLLKGAAVTGGLGGALGSVAGPVGAAVGGTVGAGLLPKALNFLATNPQAARMLTGQLGYQKGLEKFLQSGLGSSLAQGVSAPGAAALMVPSVLPRTRKKRDEKKER